MRWNERDTTVLAVSCLVPALLSALAVAALPVFYRTHGTSSRPVCTSNLKQLGSAWLQYSQDYDDHAPPAWQSHGNLGPGHRYSWRAMLMPYLGATSVFTCPSCPSARGFEAGFSGPPYNLGCVNGEADDPSLSGGYGLNRVHFADGRPEPIGAERAGRAVAFAMKGIASPAKLILLTDANPSAPWLPLTPDAPGTIRHDRAAARHVGGANYAFADGHVRWFQPQDIPCRTGECWWSVQGRH